MDERVQAGIDRFNAGDCEAGADILEEASAQGHALATEKLALIYKHGKGRKRNVAHALELLKTLPDSATAVYQLGVIYSADKLFRDDAQAVGYFRQAAEQGHVSAAYNLAFCYDRGRGVLQDPKEAKKWYLRAAEQGDRSAMVNLALMHLKVSEEGEALQLLRQAAEEGHPGGMYQLGLMHACGQGGLSRDEKAAAVWFVPAAERGLKEALTIVGTYHEDGRGGLEQSDERAAEYYQQAAEKGSAQARSALADMYERGYRVAATEAAHVERQRLLSKREEQYRRCNSSTLLGSRKHKKKPVKKAASRSSAGAIIIDEKNLLRPPSPRKPSTLSEADKRRAIEEAARAWAGETLRDSVAPEKKTLWRRSKK